MKYTCKKCGNELPADMTQECTCLTSVPSVDSANFYRNRLFYAHDPTGKRVATLRLQLEQDEHGCDVYWVIWTSIMVVSVAFAPATWHKVSVGDSIRIFAYYIGSNVVDRETWLADQTNLVESTI